MLSEADRAENWHSVVDEAVALGAILEDDFWLETANGETVELDSLAEDYSGEAERLWRQGLCFCVLVKPQIPETGLCLELEAGIGSGNNIDHLPPFRLCVHLADGYPSESLPRLTITAIWLNQEQQGSLSLELEKEAQSYLGGPITFALVSWLEQGALESLGILGSLLIPQQTCSLPGQLSGRDAGSSQQAGSSDMRLGLLQSLLQYNASTDLQNFQAGVWSCPICLEEQPGTSVIRLVPCGHHFCVECMATHVRIHLKEKRSDMLICPQPDCKERLSRQQLQSILDKDDNTAWETLELSTTLLTMQDVVFCPRCSTVCIEDSDHTAICSGCHFAFCTLCQGAYHPGRKCMSVETKLKILEERKRNLPREQGQKAAEEIRRKEEELLSLVALEKTSKECPYCGSHISRTEGCNKMKCTACGTAFCWNCMEIISGYDHFKAGGCLVFDDATIAEMQAQNRFDAHAAMEFNAAVAREGAAGGRMNLYRPDRARTCPYCGQWNYKQGNLNSMTCWACGGRYCYLCRQRLRKGEGGTHFRPTGCKQHSAD